MPFELRNSVRGRYGAVEPTVAYPFERDLPAVRETWDRGHSPVAERAGRRGSSGFMRKR